jgi:hypothetical protein
VDYENLDNHQHGIHDYFKFLKYGYARATDIASIHLRRGLISRKDALQVVMDRDGKYPLSYLRKPLEDILKKISITIEEFDQICDRFTNKELFITNKQGKLIRDSSNSLVKINYDNVGL